MSFDSEVRKTRVPRNDANFGIGTLGTNMRWCEGPVYFGDARCLLWSDIPNNRIMRWDEETGRVSLMLGGRQTEDLDSVGLRRMLKRLIDQRWLK